VTSQPFDFKSKLAQVQPKAPPTPPAEEAKKVDEVAERHEFVSREPQMRIERVRGSEPIDVLSVKGPLTVLNRFKALCNETGKPYWRILDEMMTQAGR
jgi:hypothetical protein